MKKVVLFFAFIIMSGSLFAFSPSGYGLKGGVGISNITDGKESIGPKLSLTFGGFAQFEFSKTFVFQPEVLLSFQGAESEDNPPYKFNFTYLNIPILIKYNMQTWDVFAGPYIGYKLSAEAERSGLKVDLDKMKSLDYGLTIGADFMFGQNIGGDVRINYGIANIADEGTLKNISMIAGILYKF